MKYLFILLLTQLLDCAKPPVKPRADVLSITNWRAYVSRDSINNRDIYYGLSFATDGQADQYVYYSQKNQGSNIAPPNFFDSGIPPINLTYSLNGSTLTITYPTRQVTGTYTANQLLITDQSINYIYTKW